MKRAKVTAVSVSKTGVKDNKPWTQYAVSLLSDGQPETYKTFDKKLLDYVNMDIEYEITQEGQYPKFEWQQPTGEGQPANTSNPPTGLPSTHNGTPDKKDNVSYFISYSKDIAIDCVTGVEYKTAKEKYNEVMDLINKGFEDLNSISAGEYIHHKPENLDDVETFDPDKNPPD